LLVNGGGQGFYIRVQHGTRPVVPQNLPRKGVYFALQAGFPTHHVTGKVKAAHACKKRCDIHVKVWS
jgi:hypothetical protein